MLVLSRKADECIMIDDDIRIMVVQIRGDKVRIGIDAPGRAVHREEIYLEIQRDKHSGFESLIDQSRDALDQVFAPHQPGGEL